MTSNTLSHTREQARACLIKLHPFVGSHQIAAMARGMQTGERHSFYEQTCNLWQTIKAMPLVYGHGGPGDDAIVHLHYSYGDMHWFITERDEYTFQKQAFGYSYLGSKDTAKLGYISIKELIYNQVSIDMNWQPRTLADCKLVLAQNQPKPTKTDFFNQHAIYD